MDPSDKAQPSIVTDTPKSPPPILAAKDFSAASVFEPENLLREARRQKQLAPGTVPDICLLDPDGDIVRALHRAGRASRSPSWACYHTDLFEFEQDGERFGIIGCAVGASFAVLLAEELFVSGCRFLISVTSAGQIASRGAPPYFILIDRALRDEGTSYHYLPPSEFADADDDLAATAMAGLAGLGEPIYRGASWTTDAPFRETAAAIESCRQRDILAVEMEAAALYAFARAKGKPVLCFAHVTNQMAVSEGDFEKGESDGAKASLDVIAATARAWRNSLKNRSAESTEPSGDQAALFARLKALGIETRTVPYPPHRTVEEGRALRGSMAGCFTKNLLLRDKKGKLYLIVAQEEQPIDLKTLHKRIDASGRLGFASAEDMRQLLHVEPGALTPLALVFDTAARITPVIDARLMGERQVNFHPLINTQSTGIDPRDLVRFIESTGHRPLTISFADGEAV
ncbi:MAG TPA: YbaK/EbsC family protein, partial [Stellaceae bacterium]|nr:YbaK/EbsC family protein [Stellaceae bacterium]